MFIFAMILTGIVLIVPTYLQENSGSLLLVAIKDASTQATSYLNLGVVNWGDKRYSPLNNVIINCSYRSLDMRFIGLEVLSETSTNVTVEVKFVRPPANRSVDEVLAGVIGRFLQTYLGGVSGFTLIQENDTVYHLYYRGKLVEFVVYVNGVRRVIS